MVGINKNLNFQQWLEHIKLRSWAYWYLESLEKKKKTQNLTLLLQRSNSENGLPDEAPGKLSELTARVRGPIAVQYLSKQP